MKNYLLIIFFLLFACQNSNNFKINNSNDINSNIVEQLEQLNSLYKSGVLTKEEFEKAKKKILN